MSIPDAAEEAIDVLEHYQKTDAKDTDELVKLTDKFADKTENLLRAVAMNDVTIAEMVREKID